MKIIILLFALVLGFGATCKKTADDIRVSAAKHELQQEQRELRSYPNLLPEVLIVAPRA
ncbi:hypothetical protein K3G39_14365 [Pontibacter sp. HSC-14F20]|uniref:hypothetical protein n=1 Tax=Pontibacter sp. HSC-14F20 TaxID=2864136 RepID=UPI001C7344DB|nr:hypothetical protein [Pontibacter sp. HSC-14F20]MBX0334423.1 hypothetical protein [Pontibacter sp. HSC-14F20]